MRPRPGSLEARLERHAGMIVLAAKGYYRAYRIAMGPAVDFDDLLQEYRIAALAALRDFDPSRGFAESTLVAKYLQYKTRQIITSVNYKKRIPPGGSVRTLDCTVYDDRETMADLLIDETSRGPEEVALARVSAREYLRGIGPDGARSRLILLARARGASLQEVAFEIEDVEGRMISRERVRQVKAKALKKIRRRFGIEVAA